MDGGALADVMSLYENLGGDSSEGNQDQKLKVVKQENHGPAIQVWRHSSKCMPKVY